MNVYRVVAPHNACGDELGRLFEDQFVSIIIYQDLIRT